MPKTPARRRLAAGWRPRLPPLPSPRVSRCLCASPGSRALAPDLQRPAPCGPRSGPRQRGRGGRRGSRWLCGSSREMLAGASPPPSARFCPETAGLTPPWRPNIRSGGSGGRRRTAEGHGARRGDAAIAAWGAEAPPARGARVVDLCSGRRGAVLAVTRSHCKVRFDPATATCHTDEGSTEILPLEQLRLWTPRRLVGDALRCAPAGGRIGRRLLSRREGRDTSAKRCAQREMHRGQEGVQMSDSKDLQSCRALVRELRPFSMPWRVPHGSAGQMLPNSLGCGRLHQTGGSDVLRHRRRGPRVADLVT